MNFETKSKENRIIAEIEEIIMVFVRNWSIEEEINNVKKKNCSEKKVKKKLERARKKKESKSWKEKKLNCKIIRKISAMTGLVAAVSVCVCLCLCRV